MSADNEKITSLSSLLENDRESMTSQIKADRSVANTSKVLEKEVDRLLFRYSQEEVPENRLVAAQQMMQTVKTSLPVVESVSDVEVWHKDKPAAGSRAKPVGLIFLAAGAILVLIPALIHGGGHSADDHYDRGDRRPDRELRE